MTPRLNLPTKKPSRSGLRINWLLAGLCLLALIAALAFLIWRTSAPGADVHADPMAADASPAIPAGDGTPPTAVSQGSSDQMRALLAGHRQQVASFFTSSRRSARSGTPANPQVAALMQMLDAAHDQSVLGNEQATLDELHRAHASLSDLPGAFAPTATTIVEFQLGVAYLRLGESENCCARHSSESCILPIRGAGVHTERQGSEQAVRYFRRVLDATPQNMPHHLKARWLLNIAYMTLGEYPSSVPPQYLIPLDAFGDGTGIPRFQNIAPQLGLSTFNMCGGVVVDDLDNDGDLDIITSTWDLQGRMEYFRNDGPGRFVPATEQAGLAGFSGGLNMIHGDYNNDGLLDVLVLRGAWRGTYGQIPNSLFKNEGGGRFKDVTFEAGLGKAHLPSQTAAWADFDNDGDLDLFVGNESGHGLEAACQLFENQGDGTFQDIAATAGVENRRFTKGVTVGDYDNDRWPDIYVSNLGEPNRLYRNLGDGTFEDVAAALGVDRPICSFPVWFWDYDNDGALDLYVSSYVWYRYGEVTLGLLAASYLGRMDQLATPEKVETSMLYQGSGDGTFRDVAGDQNLTKLVLPMGANFGDLDNDGYLDFFLGTGYPDYEALMPNVMFHNRQGRGFADVTIAGGFGHLQKGHAIAFADLDGDGDHDVFAQMGGAYDGDKFNDALFENPGTGNRWLAIRLVGKQSNRFGIGARLRVDIREQGSERTIYRYVNTGGSFGGNPLRQTVGLGQATKINRLSVYWPTSDSTQVFEDVPLDRSIEIVEFAGALSP